MLDRLDASAAWQSYKRHFFLGTTTAELVREGHWAKAWGREHAKEAIEQRRLENPNLRFKPKPNTEAPHGDDVEISEQLSACTSPSFGWPPSENGPFLWRWHTSTCAW